MNYSKLQIEFKNGGVYFENKPLKYLGGGAYRSVYLFPKKIHGKVVVLKYGCANANADEYTAYRQYAKTKAAIHVAKTFKPFSFDENGQCSLLFQEYFPETVASTVEDVWQDFLEFKRHMQKRYGATDLQDCNVAYIQRTDSFKIIDMGNGRH